MIFVHLVVHCNCRFIPKQYNVFCLIKRLHIKHCVQIGLNIADNDFNIVSNTVVDFSYSAGFPVSCRLLHGEIMQSYIVNASASKCECNALLNRYCRFSQRESNVACRAHEYYFMFFG